ncbi:ABC transporter ATP-binding protein [Mycobacteroides abscessus subsp. abscessus]|nr:ABC transporter ATP-binding protein [Mycobacteroides abscessus subsp. abscessus]
MFVTHDMDEAIKIADRIAILKDGEIIQFDTPERILRYPKNEFVKGFIGEDRLNDAENGQPAAADLMLRKVITARPSLFVVNGENELLGIATIDDVEKYYAEEEKTLGDIMSADYQSVLVDAPYNEVAELFAKGSLYIPVLEGGKLAGLITRSTMMRGLAGMKISSPAEGGTINE